MKTLVKTLTLVAAVMAVVCQIVVDDSQATVQSTATPVSLLECSQSNLVMERMDQMPLAFTENRGQWDERVKFRANASGATMWFTEDGVYYQFSRRISVEGPTQDQIPEVGYRGVILVQSGFQSGRSSRETRTNVLAARPSGSGQQTSSSVRYDQLDSIEQLVIKTSFVGANPNPRVVGANLMEYKCNHFIGNDPSSWRAGVPNYEAITFEDIYSGIDLTYYGNGRQIEYDFIVSPGADYSQIQIQYHGADALAIAEDGALVVTTDWGELRELAPVVYQEVGGVRKAVTAEYVIQSDLTFGFRLGAEFDPMLPVTIDPVLVYSTYLGGTGDDSAVKIAVDGSGCAYVVGITNSTNFPTEGPYQGTYQGGTNDAFVTKLSAAGNSLVYSTYLGGSGHDQGHGITIDGSGCAYVTGWTESTNFPTENPYQTNQSGWDAFVTKLSVSGDSLVYSTYLGGNDGDFGYEIAVDVIGYAYVVGHTRSTNFPTQNPYQTDQGAADAFVTKLTVSGNSLVYSTYLGGTADDFGYRIDVDVNGSAYVAGHTESTNFPTQNPIQGTYEGLGDVFVTKLSAVGSSLVYSTYLGGYSSDSPEGIVVDDSGCAYVTGSAWSPDFPTQNPYQGTNHGGGDAFVVKLNVSGSSLIYGTFLGGNMSDIGDGVAVDDSGCVYVAGYTRSTDFPTQNSLQTLQGESDAFVTKLSAQGDSLIYSSYLGGNDWEVSGDIAVDGSGCAYVTGSTGSTDFPTRDPYQTNQGQQDAFVTKLYDYHCGDADASGSVDIDDVVYLVNYIFDDGPEPTPYESGDADCSGGVDIDDVVFLINYIFSDGNAPCDLDGDGVPDC